LEISIFCLAIYLFINQVSCYAMAHGPVKTNVDGKTQLDRYNNTAIKTIDLTWYF
jgi:hypothetical protein